MIPAPCGNAVKDFRSSFSDASVPGSAWDRTGEEAPPHGQQAEPAIHEVPRQSRGTRIVHRVALADGALNDR